MINQRIIVNDISPDFCRDSQAQEAYISGKCGQIIDFVARYVKKSGARGIVLGISGGIDSFLVGALCAKALRETGGKLQLALLPNGGQADYADAQQSAAVIRKLYANVVCDTVSIQSAYLGAIEDLSMASGFTDDAYTLGNLQPRIRMMYQYALAKNMLVAGTDHATESVTGFYTKYGDGGTDINPIQELVKDDIYEMSKLFDVPDVLLTKRPAAGLGISADDESELGIGYGDLCAYLKGRRIAPAAAEKIERAYAQTRHKRALPASLKDEYHVQEPYAFLMVDFINGFIEKELPCENGKEALRQCIAHINRHPEAYVLYVKDQHPEDHCSFKENGGIWNRHAVEGTHGAAFPGSLYTEIKKTVNTPLEKYNVFCKGMDAACEQYTGMDALNPVFGLLRDNLTRNVVVGGMATEYCVLQTVKGLLDAGHRVTVLEDSLGYVNRQGHIKALQQMEKLGAQIY